MITDIENNIPTRWDHITGNRNLKEHFWDMAYCIQKEGHRRGFNTLITGDSRTGKTSTITLGIKTIGCSMLDFETFNPCGRCANCKAKVELYGNDGWENFVDVFETDEASKKSVRFTYLPMDCTRLNEIEIENLVEKVGVDDGNIKIVYLDEVHRLVRRGLDERLLKPMETSGAIWIASSAYVKKEDCGDGNDDARTRRSLEVMFQNRFTFRLETQKPSIDELVLWLGDRCIEWGIGVPDPESTLERLAERSCCLPGMALHVLNKASKKRSKRLTRQMVDEHIFNFND